MRTFIAIDASPAVAQLAGRIIDRLAACHDTIRWVKPDSMHFTLKFLGEVPTTASFEICRAVKRAVAEIEPFTVVCGPVGAFPDAVRPRTIWLGMEEGLEELAALHRAVEDAMFEMGYPREGRNFHPHLTLGRAKQTCRELPKWLKELPPPTPTPLIVRDVVVYSSELRSDGPIYTTLGRSPLGVARRK